jgi:hypothetical protein
MPKHRKNGRTHDVSRDRPRSRKRTALVAGSSGDAFAHLGAGLARLVGLAAERMRAERAYDARPTPEAREGRAAARRAETRFAYELRTSGPRAEVDAFRRALVADGGRLLALVGEAHPDFAPVLAGELHTFARVIVERGVRDPGAIDLLARWAVDATIAHATAGRIMRGGLGRDDFADLDRARREAGREARLNLRSALDLAGERRAAAMPAIDFDAAVRAFEQRQAAELGADDTSGPEHEPDEHARPERHPTPEDAPAGLQSARTTTPNPAAPSAPQSALRWPR